MDLIPKSRRTWEYAQNSPKNSVGRWLGTLPLGPLGRADCWDAIEDARTEFTSRLRKEILDYLEANNDKVRECGAILNLSLFMVGSSALKAKPTIMCVSEDKKVRKEAFNMIKESGILKKYPGFELAHIPLTAEFKNLRFLAGGDANSVCDTSCSRESAYICSAGECVMEGRRLYFYDKPDSKAPCCTETAGGIITYGGKYMVLTVNHSLKGQQSIRPEAPQIPTADTEGDDSDCEITGFSDYDEEAGDDFIDDTSRGSVTPDSRISGIEGSESASSESNIYGQEHAAEVQARLESLDQSPQTLTSEATPKDCCIRLGEVILSSESLDFALIEVDPASIHFDANHADPVRLDDDSEIEMSPRDAAVKTITPNGGTIGGTLSGTPSYVRLPHSRSFTEIYLARLNRPLVPGDCGCWVRDVTTGRIFGHVFAGSPTSGIAMVMPARDVFQKARSSLAHEFGISNLESSTRCHTFPEASTSSAGDSTKPENALEELAVTREPMASPRADQLAFLLFGDQSSDIHGFLSKAFCLGNSGILATVFLDQASDALRKEIDGLGKLERSKVPTFTTLRQLNEAFWLQKMKHSGVEAALLCIAQLAHYIDYTEKNDEDVIMHERVHLVGLCTGLFAAAAIASTKSLSSLVRVAVQATLMAFRTGSHVDALAERLHPVTEESESWTYIFPGLSEEQAASLLADFHHSTLRPMATRTYLSAIYSNSVAISGPPTTLKALTEYANFPNKPTSIAVHGPYHARHLHSSTDVASILRLDDVNLSDALVGTKPRSAVMSGSNGTWFSETDTRSLFKVVAYEVLNEPLRLNTVLDGCLKLAQNFSGEESLITSFGQTGLASALANLLRSKTDLKVTLRKVFEVEGFPSSIGSHGSSSRAKLAIIGMAGRFPDAESHEKLWELLEKGLNVHRVMPTDRFRNIDYANPTNKATSTGKASYGCWIAEPGAFDARFFNMSPREASHTDPMQRMALTTAYEALEMSGYVPNRTPSTRLDRIGTFYGQTSAGWRELNASSEDGDTYYITHSPRAFSPNRINYFFNFAGPSINIDTAGSSSAAALNIACNSLWARDCDTAIVGGSSCVDDPGASSRLKTDQLVSKDTRSVAFDAQAASHYRGDACASVVVKRLEDALADNDRILAVILGTSTNHSTASEGISNAHTVAASQSLLSRKILDEAGVDPLDVEYVEMHSIDAQCDSRAEMVSVTDVFSPTTRKRPSERPLSVGAVKANIGHGEAASGITALIKVLMMLQKSAIPPQVGINPKINRTLLGDLPGRNVNIPTVLTPFRRRDFKPRRVFINNFSAAGGNTGLLLEDASESKSPIVDPRCAHIITVTAKTKSAMIRNAEKLATWISEHLDTPLSHVAYTTTARRIQHNWRMNITVNELNEAPAAIHSQLQAAVNQAVVHHVSPLQPKIAFLFTGQGSQYTGLGRDLYAHYSVFRQSIDEFNKIAEIHGFPSFIPLVNGSEEVHRLSPVVVQVGLCCVQMALTRLWASWGITPSVVAGHSLGEYAALNAAGILSASDTIYLVGTRAQLLVEKCTADTHSLLAVNASIGAVKDAFGDKTRSFDIACINTHRETVLSGKAADITTMALQLRNTGFRCTQLRVPFALHSAQVEPILDDYEMSCQSVRFQAPKLPIISPLLGKVVDGESINPKYLKRHTREPVNFLGGLTSAQSGGIITEETVWLELGPHPVCAGIVKAAFGASTIAVSTLRRTESTDRTLSHSLCALHSAGAQIDWSEFHRDFMGSVRLVDMPSYSFDEKNYWMKYTGDWCLTKAEVAQPKLSTTTVQKVIHEEVKGDIAIVEIESDLSREDLWQVVSGHLVNGTPVCPSSLYGDMALTVCDYAFRLVRPNTEKISINVADMEVRKLLILDDTANSRALRLSVTANTAAGYANLTFHTGEGANKIEHASCKAFYSNANDWATEFDRVTSLIKDRISLLKAAQASGKASKMGRSLAYKLSAALVADYGSRYQGMEEIILDCNTCEATAKVVLQTSDQDGDFFFNPYHIDSLCHISGFTINSTDTVDSREQFFISMGWDSMRFVEKPVNTQSYCTYVWMQPLVGSKMMAGDVYVLDDDKVIGICGNIKFQAVPRKVLNMVLPPRGVAAIGMAKSSSAARATATKVFSSKERKRIQENTTAKSLQKFDEKSTTVISHVMNIIAKEVGVDHTELADNVHWSDLGVDSLMALIVAGRVREDLELEIDCKAFVDYPTVGNFKVYFARWQSQDRGTSSTSPDSWDTDGSEFGVSRDMDSESTCTTPPNETEDFSVKNDQSVEINRVLQRIIQDTIATEMGVEVEELITAPDLASLGMDSLMSLSILGTLREKTNLDLPSDLFVCNLSLKNVEAAITHLVATPKKRTGQRLSVARTITAAKSALATTAANVTRTHRVTAGIDDYPHRRATSVLLSGSNRAATKHLFMIPDESGSSTSYVECCPSLPADYAVWGLFSPFQKTPEEYSYGVYGMATTMISEMKRRQPTGPYNLAGWSTGGVIAYEMINQLTQAGDRVEHLITIDALAPMITQPIDWTMFEWFGAIGLLGKGGNHKLPSWLVPHMVASVRAVNYYSPKPLPEDKCPNIMIIWCSDGICHLPVDPRPDPYPTGSALLWLKNRIDFGPNGWDVYLNAKKMTIRRMPGNHFSMMRGDLAEQLSSLIREALMA